MRKFLVLPIILTASVFTQNQMLAQNKTVTTCATESIEGGKESQTLILKSSGTFVNIRLQCSNTALDSGKYHDCPISVPKATVENSEQRRCGKPGNPGDNCADMSVERCDFGKEGSMNTFTCTVKNADGAYIKNLSLCADQQ
jgi:hypothetical protein